MKALLLLFLCLACQAQTVSRTVAWKYNFADNSAVTGFELIYSSNGASNFLELGLVTSTVVTLTVGQFYDFELRAVCASLPGVKSPPALAHHLALPSTPAFIQTNALLTATNAMIWQRSRDFRTWESTPLTASQINVPIDSPLIFYRLAGGAARSNRLTIQKTL